MKLEKLIEKCKEVFKELDSLPIKERVEAINKAKNLNIPVEYRFIL